MLFVSKASPAPATLCLKHVDRTNMKVAAGLALFRGHDRLLLTHPTNARWYGSWSIPKGLVEPGEDLIEAAIREKEEVGITIFRSQILPGGKVPYLRGDRVTKLVHWFAVDVTALAPPDRLPHSWLQLAEVDEAGFMTRAEAWPRILTQMRPILDRLPAKTSRP